MIWVILRYFEYIKVTIWKEILNAFHVVLKFSNLSWSKNRRWNGRTNLWFEKGMAKSVPM